MSTTSSASHQAAFQTLNEVLQDFKLPLLKSNAGGTRVKFVGSIPPFSKTKSEKINLTFIGAIPSLANAVAASQIYEARGGRPQEIEIDLRRGHNYIDPDIGMTPSINGQEITLDVLAGNPYNQTIFRTKDGKFAVLSAVYVDLVYQWSSFLGCSVNLNEVKNAVLKWNAKDLEDACQKVGMPMALCQTEESWKSTPHGSHMSKLPIVQTQPLGLKSPAPKFLPRNPSRPLSGLKVLCATHAIAGPSTGRTLAEHGASVLQIMYTHGYEHGFVYTYANLGTASTRLNFHKESDRKRMWDLIKEAHVYLDSYRPGAISKFGFSDEKMIEANPSIIICRLRCYGTTGPWSSKPGFDMQGSASSGLMGYMGEEKGTPRWPPGMVINDYTTGYFAALAIQSCILRRLKGEPGADGPWLVSPALTGTAMAILKLFKSSRWTGIGRDEVGKDSEALAPEILEQQTKLGYMKTLRPLPKMSVTPIHYEYGLLSPMGSNIPCFPGYEDSYDVLKVEPMLKEEIMREIAISALKRIEYLRQMGKKFRNEEDPIDQKANKLKL